MTINNKNIDFGRHFWNYISELRDDKRCWICGKKLKPKQKVSRTVLTTPTGSVSVAIHVKCMDVQINDKD